MDQNVIQPTEFDIFINSIKKFQVDDIGSDDWLESHEILIKFNQQAIIEASTYREELVKELFILNEKLETLVHEAYCVLIWRTKILPEILLNVCDTNPTFMLYTILYHEAVAISLLEILLYNENGCQALCDIAIDLIDYCAQSIVQLIGLAHLKQMHENIDPRALNTENASNEIDRQKKDLLYKIGLRCLTILSFIADKIDTMSISVVRRMVVTHDIPCLMSEVLNCQPWIRNIKGVEKFIDDKWILISEIDAMKVTKIEAHVWFCLRQLLFSRQAMSFYEINEFRQREISKCQELLSVNLLDQLPPLADLKHKLCTFTNLDLNATSGNIILEEIPEIKNKIIANAKQIGYEQITKNHINKFFQLKECELAALARRLSDTYNVEIFEKLDEESKKSSNDDHYCAECCTLSYKKCSKCEQSYYCSRECQIKNWPKHKQFCLSK